MPPSGCLRSCKKCFRFRRRPQPRAHYSAISEVSRNHPDCDGPRRSHESSVAAARNPPFLGKAKSLSGIPFREPILVPPHRYGPRCCSSIKRRGVTAPTFSDHVEYVVWGGSLVSALLVAPDVHAILEYRTGILRNLFAVAIPAKRTRSLAATAL